jgi:hypothetical protein
VTDLERADALLRYFSTGPGAGMSEAGECAEIAEQWVAVVHDAAPETAAVRALAERVSALTSTGTGAYELRLLIAAWARGR